MEGHGTSHDEPGGQILQNQAFSMSQIFSMIRFSEFILAIQELNLTYRRRLDAYLQLFIRTFIDFVPVILALWHFRYTAGLHPLRDVLLGPVVIMAAQMGETHRQFEPWFFMDTRTKHNHSVNLKNSQRDFMHDHDFE
jgi:hypothetical protein